RAASPSGDDRPARRGGAPRPGGAADAGPRAPRRRAADSPRGGIGLPGRAARVAERHRQGVDRPRTVHHAQEAAPGVMDGLSLTPPPPSTRLATRTPEP